MTTTERRSTVTIEVTNITAAVVKCKANKAFTIGGVSVSANQTFYLVKSSEENRYYVVIWVAERSMYQCSCGAGVKNHKHIKHVTLWIKAHVVLKKEPVVQTLAINPVAVPVVASVTPPCKDEVRGQLNGNRGFNLLRK